MQGPARHAPRQAGRQGKTALALASDGWRRWRTLLVLSQDRVIHLTPTELRFFKTRGTAKDGKIWKKVDLKRGEIAVAVDDTVIFQVRTSRCP